MQERYKFKNMLHITIMKGSSTNSTGHAVKAKKNTPNFAIMRERSMNLTSHAVKAKHLMNTEKLSVASGTADKNTDYVSH